MRLYKLALFVQDFLNSALPARSNHVLHLHCLHCEDGVSFFELGALFNEYFWDCSWHRGHCFFGSSFILAWFLPVIWFKFEPSRISFGIKQMHSVLLNMELHLPHLPINNHIQLPRLHLRKLKLVMILANNHRPTFIILEFSRQSNMFIILHLNWSLINWNIMDMGRARHISEIEELFWQWACLGLVMISCDHGRNYIERIGKNIFFEEIIDVLRNVTGIIIALRKNRVVDDSLQEF